MITMGFFAALMGVSFAQVCYTLLSDDNTSTQTTEQIRGALVNELMVFEGVDSVLVLVCLAAAGLPLARRAVADPLATWLVAGPALVVMLGVNIGYTLTLRGLAGVDADEMPIDVDLAAGWIAIVLVCVQPAVMEELFFRYLLLGHLRSNLGLHGAVWVSSIIFGMAHLGNPIGWPILILLGAGLGYSRVASGSLALPIALHFLHNLAVLVCNELMFR
jgi:membrane protease YdiL (CAAX protease family)